jgi:large subunit ribosomal protein L25
VTLKIADGKVKDKTVVIKEIQRDPIKDSVLHVDFNEISLTDTLKVNVPVHSKGEPEGVKKDGGILEHIMWEVQVECLPTDIPEKIDVDVSNLKISEAIYVKNLVLSDKIKVLNDPELIIMIVKPPKVEVAKEEVPGADSSEPELIRKKKEEAPEEGGAAAKEAEKPAPSAGKEGK